ncbi:MAG: hypothetical protein A2Y15_08020 [Clostridiales bacterium GWF2_36_10]|nr:MAG: hypothetical protein A2Y15_08020 [Clostridiales bacterium GWF2_36_10]HAN20374.1 hypothetical protein [Clostridiales bacterium]
MKKYVKIISLALILVFVFSIPNNYVNAISTLDSVEKISKELKEVLETKNEDELISVDVWFNDADDEEVENEVKTKIGVNKKSFIDDSGDNQPATLEKVNQYIETERKISKEKQNAKHDKFLNDYNLYKDFKNIENRVTFKSQYAPVISMKLYKNEIEILSRDSRVSIIFLRQESEFKDDCNISVPLIRANYTRDTLGLTGSGIKVGQIESGMPSNTATSDLAAANITYDPNVAYTNTIHANRVASIIIEIAPDVEIYSTITTSNWRERAEWLLNQGVNVINMSAGNYSSGTYGSDDKWVDHIAINHSVHFVKSAGNNGEGSFYEDYTITSPGMAYNAITVGAIDDMNTSSQGDDVIASYSSYAESGTTTNKPDLVAPGSNITTDAGTESGTSFAAPHVTAVIAQMLELSPSLKTKQAAMKSILTASIRHDGGLRFNNDSPEFDEYGAGLIDATSSRYTIYNNRYVASYFSAGSAIGSEKSYYFNVSSVYPMRVSLAWSKYNNFSSGSHTGDPDILEPLVDLDIRVYNPNGSLVASSTDVDNNVEIVQFDVYMTGQYHIKIRQCTNINETVWFGVAWWSTAP